jgi:hypothetical protein
VVDFDQKLGRPRWFEQSTGLKRQSADPLSTKGAPYATCRQLYLTPERNR